MHEMSQIPLDLHVSSHISLLSIPSVEVAAADRKQCWWAGEGVVPMLVCRRGSCSAASSSGQGQRRRATPGSSP